MSMKCLINDKLQSAIADSENPSFPASKILNEAPEDPWIAADGVDTATLTLSIAGGSNVVALAGIKAISLDIIVKDGDGNEVASGSIDLSGINNYYQWLTQTGIQPTTASFSYPIQMSAHTAEITASSEDTANPPRIGVVDCGIIMSHATARQLELQMVERGAVEDTYYDGGSYYIPGTMLKQFSASGRYQLSPDFWQFVELIVGIAKKNPKFWWLVDTDNIQWLVYARITEYPDAPISGDFAIASFKLLEEKG